MDFRLLRPEEVIELWPSLRTLLAPAVAAGRGELLVDDIRSLVLDGRMFVFAGLEDGEPILGVTAEFIHYPQLTVLNICFGSGRVPPAQRDQVYQTVERFARLGGARRVRTYCQHEGMVRYHERYSGAKRAYTVLEKNV